MLITFQSRADADVIMLGPNGLQMLDLLGKDRHAPQGILTVEQLPAAIAALDAAFAADRAQTRPTPDEEDEPDEDAPRGMAAPVSLAQRIVPLLELLRIALREGQVVTWEASGT